MEKLVLLDYLIFAFCLIFTLFASVLAYQKSKSLEDSVLNYILMGRQLSLPIFIATLVSTWYGGLFGVTQIAYESGIYNFITQGLFWYVAYLVMAFFLVKKIRALNVVTLPELVEKLFGPKAGKIAALFNFFNVVPIAYTISLGLFLQALFGGNSYIWMSLGLVFVLFYSALSGFRAIVYTDMIQFFIMCTAVLMVLIFSLFQFGGPEFLIQELPPHYFSLESNHGWLSLLSWGFIAMATLIDPNFYQRILAAGSDKIAKKGIIISTGVWLIFDLSTTFGAMYARAVMPEADSSNAYLHYAIEILPAGLGGFFLAGVLATILSTMDSYVFVAGNTISYDFLGLRQKTKWLHRFSIIMVGALSLVMAYVFEGNIREVWKTLGSYSAGALLVPVLYGFYKPGRLSETGFIVMVVSSCAGVTYWRFFQVNSVIDDLYIGLLLGFLVLIGLSAAKSFKKIKTNG